MRISLRSFLMSFGMIHFGFKRAIRLPWNTKKNFNRVVPFSGKNHLKGNKLKQPHFEGEFDVILLLEVVIDDGEVVKEDGHQVGTVETPVLLIRDILFDKRHAVEIAQEVGAPDVGGINTLVAEFAEKTAVAAIDGTGDTSEVAEVVIGGTSVDVVDSHTGRDLRDAPSHIDGMGSKDSFHATESMPEVQIPLFALRIVTTSRILVR